MTQMRIRMRKLSLKTREKITTLPRKEVKREARREEKAEKAAVLEKSIEKELLVRLQNGLYPGDICNANFEAYKKVIDMVEKSQAVEEEDEMIEEEEAGPEYVEFEEEDDIEDFGAFAVHESQGNGSDDENDGSAEDDETEALNQRKAKRKMTLASKKLEKDTLDSKSKKAKVLIEVEHDDAVERQRAVL
ncbi:putative mak16 protein [Medicago truncatula]|uniref:Putative mak16 protein n=1 Tax=Medicago truncatula TaxID=3880 RepID=A0A396IAK7_MEDTR|nr:putative mak16 protein [Medicago truncatula]